MNGKLSEASEARRYRSGGTSWHGYLAATGRRDRAGERAELCEAARQAAGLAEPDSACWRERALAAQQAASASVPDDATWRAAHDLLPPFDPLTWRAISCGYDTMLHAIQSAPPDRPLGPAALAAAFMAAQAAG